MTFMIASKAAARVGLGVQHHLARPAAAAAQGQVRFHHPDPFDPKATKGWKAAVKEGTLPTTNADRETEESLHNGLAGASSIEDKTIPTFSRGELPHFAGINTFMKAKYIEDVRECKNYDATVVGIPFDGGCTYRSGTRFGPQGIRRISALYTPYNYERGIDLREQMSLCDAGDVFTIPANIEKSFDQISNAVAHVAASGSFPVLLGGDHSIGTYVRGSYHTIPYVFTAVCCIR
jgi:agmatinase